MAEEQKNRSNFKEGFLLKQRKMYNLERRVNEKSAIDTNKGSKLQVLSEKADLQQTDNKKLEEVDKQLEEVAVAIKNIQPKLELAILLPEKAVDSVQVKTSAIFLISSSFVSHKNFSNTVDFARKWKNID